MSNIFVKENVSENEYFIHEWVYYLIKNNSNSKENHINIKVPKIYNYDSENLDNFLSVCNKKIGESGCRCDRKEHVVNTKINESGLFS